MGRSERVRYALHVMLNTGAVTPIAWNSNRNWHGRACAKSVKKWVETFEASCAPGKCNAHLGTRKVLSAVLVDTFCGGAPEETYCGYRVIASYKAGA